MAGVLSMGDPVDGEPTTTPGWILAASWPAFDLLVLGVAGLVADQVPRRRRVRLLRD